LFELKVMLCVDSTICHVTSPPVWIVTVAGLNREPAVEITVGLGVPGAGGAAGGALAGDPGGAAGGAAGGDDGFPGAGV
jgi:hypothetical protein